MPTRPLPDNPSFEHLRKEAKRLHQTMGAGNADALARVKEFHPRATGPGAHWTLADAQLVTARSYGFASWTSLKEHFAAKYETSAIDGVRIRYSDGAWALVRASNTGPIIVPTLVPAESQPSDRVLELGCTVSATYAWVTPVVPPPAP